MAHTHFEFSDSQGFHFTRKDTLAEAREYASRMVNEDRSSHVDIYQTEWVTKARRNFPDMTLLTYTQRLNFIERVHRIAVPRGWR